MFNPPDILIHRHPVIHPFLVQRTFIIIRACKPIEIAAFVMSYFIVGAEAMQSAAGVPFALVYTIEGIILFSLAAGQYLMSRGRK